MIITIIELFMKVALIFVDWFVKDRAEKERLYKLFEKSIEDSKQEAAKSASLQQETKRLKEIDPWQKDTNSKS